MPRLPDDAQIERIAQLLERRAVPFKGFNLEALDGYLSAVALSPEPVPADQWQPPIWGTPPRWESEAERAQVAAMLEDQLHLATQRACFDGDDLPELLAPLLWLPEDPDAEDDNALDVGRDWAFGFFRGVELREAAWERWLDESEWVDEIFHLLDQLASGEILAEDPTQAPTPIDHRQPARHARRPAAPSHRHADAARAAAARRGSRTQRAVPVRQRTQVQEVLRSLS